MDPKALLRIRKPLFFKLAVIFMITSLAVISAVASYLVFSLPHGPRGPRASMQSNMVFHVNALTDKIGIPPNHAKAAQLAAQLGLKIRVEGPDLPWSSSPGMAPTENFVANVRDNIPGNIQIGRMDGSFFMLLQRGPYHFLFVFPGNPDFSLPVRSSLALLGLLIIILLMSYATVNWLLKPLTQLVTGVSEITNGNLNYKVDVGHGHDEFRSLGGAFNQMTEKVRSMLKAKERLLADVSHELRSPLARMKVALAMLPKSSNQKSISRAADEMETMLSEILESERMKSSHGSLSRTQVNLVKLAGRLNATTKEQRPGLKLARPKKFPMLQLDEAKVELVLKNVVENSLKYSQGQRRKVEIHFFDEEKFAGLKVLDFGIGIPEEDLKLVFEPFYRVDKSRTKKTGGYGLGLSLCREVMQAHGGEISLSSRPGTGTEVTLKFPKK